MKRSIVLAAATSSLFDVNKLLSLVIQTTLNLALRYWYITALIVIVWLWDQIGPDIIKMRRHQKAFRRVTEWRTDNDQLQWIRGMTPKQFEEFVAELFRKLGYSAEAVGKSHDEGIDVVIEKDGHRHYVQCKKYVASVPAHAVRDFFGAMVGRGADSKGFFVTTGVFSEEAMQFAQDKPIELIDGQELIRLIQSVSK